MRQINLLPPESREKQAARRKIAVWILVGIGYLIVLGLLTIWYQGKVDDAQRDLEAQQGVVADLRAEVDDLADFEFLRTTFDERAATVAGILSRDIAWGRLLNDFGRLIPPRVWLDSFTGAAGGDLAATIGQITVTGTGFDYPDVASWLRVLDSANFPGVSETWVSSVNTSEVGAATVVDFTSSTALTVEALSDRLLRLIPEVP